MYRYYFYFLFLCLLMFSGCSGKQFGTVSGSVTYQEKPVTSGGVLFVTENKCEMFSAMLDGTGQFSLPKPIETGKYLIMVMPADLPPVTDFDGTVSGGGKVSAPKGGIPMKYQQPETTPLIEIVEKGKNVFDLKLEKN